jgi:hypothetical protein
MSLSNAAKHIAFDQPVIAIISAAFEGACAELNGSSALQVDPSRLRQVIAERVLQMARLGERDILQLRADAVRHASSRFALSDGDASGNSYPHAGPHARPDLTNEDTTPGPGTLPGVGADAAPNVQPTS